MFGSAHFLGSGHESRSSQISRENHLTSRIDTIPEARAQAESRRWWDANPMSYDWHKTILPAEGTPEFYREIDRRLFSSSSFYRRPGYFLFAVARKDARNC